MLIYKSSGNYMHSKKLKQAEIHVCAPAMHSNKQEQWECQASSGI
jgi:hypothetical protein